MDKKESPFKNIVPILSSRILPDGTKEYVPNNSVKILEYLKCNPQLTWDEGMKYFMENYKDG
jgi:hypothetical protein